MRNIFPSFFYFPLSYLFSTENGAGHLMQIMY